MTEVLLRNEFGEALVRVVATRNGSYLELRAESGACLRVDAFLAQLLAESDVTELTELVQRRYDRQVARSSGAELRPR